MLLRDRCSKAIKHNTWSRGEDYFRAGKVDIDEWDKVGLHATVTGSEPEPYEVHLDWSEASDSVIWVGCTCAHCADGHICKHIAAAILAADRRGIEVSGQSRLDVTIDDEFIDRSLNDDDEKDDVWSPDLDAGGWGSAGDSPTGVLKAFARMATNSVETRRSAVAAKPADAAWKKALKKLSIAQTEALERRFAAPRSSGKSVDPRLWYGIDIEASLAAGVPYVGVRRRARRKDGSLGRLSKAKLRRQEIEQLEFPEDRELVGLLFGNEADWSGGSYAPNSSHGFGQDYAGAFVNRAMNDVVLPRLCASGRFGLIVHGATGNQDEIHPLTWDDGPAWQFHLNAGLSNDRKCWQIRGALVRGEETADLKCPLLLTASGIIVFGDRIARFSTDVESFQWLAALRTSEGLEVAVKDQDEFVAELAALPEVPRGNWPDELSWQDVRPAPQPVLKISSPAKKSWRTDLDCRIEFDYGDWRVVPGAEGATRFDREARRVVHRDLASETAAFEHVIGAGAKRNPYRYNNIEAPILLNPKKLGKVVQAMTAAGWTVEAEGRLFRQPGEFRLSISSGVDWFDLEVTCDFDGVSASLPKLLAALRRGEGFVELDDGSRGMLPADWLARYAPLAQLGEAKGDHLRFVPTQAALLDALLAAQQSQQIVVDEAFTRLRERLHSFHGVQPQHEPETFRGELRQYQREGLGWLHFLREFSFGGCLADDMGLGKTIQVLALLEERRMKHDALPNDGGLSPFLASAKGEEKRSFPVAARDGGTIAKSPSLVVVPRSLVFNWIEEARRFTPQIRVLNYTGLERKAVADQLTDFDLIVTTYGTLRRDIVKLKDIQFDYAILDEAQAVKNAASQAAKAVRLLQARHRLAMTGTPVENHLGELWSLLEFLNPGMLGRCGKLTDLFVTRRRGKSEDAADPGESLSLLARALRPFLLRRTKQQVLTELPPKSEQTLYCELDDTERKLYNELREHYRQTLLAKISRDGVNKSKIHVLEALLRLRQAACHPGLLDKKKTRESSSKLETLLEQLAEVVDEGHKALVFSQFTSLLAIVRHQLDERKIVYEYLDGKTVKRQDRVERFQSDPNCPLFLISLKAGGQGLNLTAADYVFILDPWWNPAVEAQAVDRAHRIGQNRHVFAYRLIARDTVEEKILELQAHKRDLAEAIISADNSLLRNLTADDLQLLLS